MKTAWLIPLIVLAVLIGIPLAVRPASVEVPRGARRVIVVTPHNEQIRSEFGGAFERWHRRRYGEPAQVVWSTPGGTSEISKLLRSSWEAALRDGREPGGDADLLFGGGSFEFEQLSKPIVVKVDGTERSAPVLEQSGFTQDELEALLGTNDIGGRKLYDPQGRWIGAALSGFGIVWNEDLLRGEIDRPAPTTWSDLADPRFRGWIAMVNPAQSSSIATAMEAILQREGWEQGWRILRRTCANARSYSASSPRVPIDVSQGDAAAGICIDFYGRTQSQILAEADRARSDGADGTDGGERPPRIGYADPAGKTVIDADPIAVLRNPVDREMARRFIEFVLTDEGQALWQFRAGSPGGPERFELRRMPIKRSFIAANLDRFVDRVDPFSIAQVPAHANADARRFVTPIFSGMAMDVHALLTEAWRRIVSHPDYARAASAAPSDGIVTADMVDDPQLARWLRAFDALPKVPGPAGASFDLGDPAQLRTIAEGWIGTSDRPPAWRHDGLWPAGERGGEALRRQLRDFFSAQYRSIIDDDAASTAVSPGPRGSSAAPVERAAGLASASPEHAR